MIKKNVIPVYFTVNPTGQLYQRHTNTVQRQNPKGFSFGRKTL